MSVVRQRVAKHVPATTNNSVAVQHAVTITIKEEMSSMCPPLNYIPIYMETNYSEEIQL
jgi:hypothetical protein